MLLTIEESVYGKKKWFCWHKSICSPGAAAVAVFYSLDMTLFVLLIHAYVILGIDAPMNRDDKYNVFVSSVKFDYILRLGHLFFTLSEKSSPLLRGFGHSLEWWAWHCSFDSISLFRSLCHSCCVWYFATFTFVSFISIQNGTWALSMHLSSSPSIHLFVNLFREIIYQVCQACLKSKM